jgi:hypothetical protein
MTRSRLALPLALLLAAPVAAQGTISTDRPGLGLGTAVTPPGVFQIELGLPAVATTDAGEGSVTAYSFPTLLRVGLLDRLELRAGSPVITIVNTDDGTDSESVEGFGDVEVGAKYALTTGGDGVPAVALVPSVVLPTGEEGFSAGDPVINGAVVAGFALPSALGLTTIVYASLPTADGALASGGLVAALGRALTGTLSGYVEGGYFLVEDPEGAGDAGNDPAYVGAGAALLATPTLQLDAFFDVGLNDAASDLLFGFGVSTRFGGR